MCNNVDNIITNWVRILIVIIFFLFSVACCKKPEASRTIYGLVPLEKSTVQTEELCNSLAIPSEAILLESRIQSKKESAVITKVYSTEKPCHEINLFFRDTLVPKRWQIIPSDTYTKFFNLETHYGFELEDNKIGITCGDLRDYCGIKRFYISCSWN